MKCLGNPVLNTTLTISGAYLRNWTEPASDEEEGLSRGGIAGIVIACVVAFLFIVGLIISLKGTLWFQSLCKCCKNKTQSIPDESPRAGDIERRETGLAGGNDIAHQPSNQVSIQPSPNKDLTRQPLSGLLDPELLGSSSAGGFNNDLNATGQNLLSNGKQSHEGGPGQGTSELPNIHKNKAAAAKEWNNLDGEQHLSNPASDRALKRNE